MVLYGPEKTITTFLLTVGCPTAADVAGKKSHVTRKRQTIRDKTRATTGSTPTCPGKVLQWLGTIDTGVSLRT